MKTVYLIRHGQTRFNKDWRHQHPAVDLSPKGWDQAELAGDYAKTLELDVIITSDLLRARQTAEVIAGKTGVAVEVSEEFREIQRPSSVWGKHYFRPLSVWAMILITLHSGNQNWRYSDEESVAMFESRIKTALHTLVRHEKDTIMLVSHRAFIAGLLAVIKNGHLDAFHFARVITRALVLDNTSISTITYDEVQKKWNIVEVGKCPNKAVDIS